MPRYKYSTISTEEELCNGEIFANDDDEAIKIGKEGRAQVIFRAVTKDLKIAGWKEIYKNPTAVRH